VAETVKDVPISSTELILQIWERMKNILGGRQISFATDSDPIAEIANDSDGHRTRIGYMRYTHVALIKAGERNFLLARGIKHGQYPAELYDSDLTACPIEEEELADDEEELLVKVNNALSRSVYFRYSLVFTKMDGDLMVTDSHLAQSVVQKMRTIESALVAVDPEYGSNILLSTLTPVVNRTTKYYPDAPGKLADVLIEVLKESRF